MIAALTSPSISDIEIVAPSTIARLGETGSAFGVGEGATTVGAGVAAGFWAGGLDVAPRRGVCAATTMNKRTAANPARINLGKFIRGIFLLGARASLSVPLPAIWSTIIFEETNFSKTWCVSVWLCAFAALREIYFCVQQFSRKGAEPQRKTAK